MAAIFKFFYKNSFLLLAGVLLVIVSGEKLSAAEEDIKYESGPPKVHLIKLRQPRKNWLSRHMGTKKSRLHVWSAILFETDSNLFSDEVNRKSDVLQTKLAGFDLRYEENDKLKFKLFADWRYNKYDTYFSRNNHEWTILPKLKWEISDAFSLTIKTDHKRSFSVVDTEDTALSGQRKNGGSVIFAFKPADNWGIDLSYMVKDNDYSEPVYHKKEHWFQAVTLNPWYKLSDKTKLYTKIKVDKYDYEHNENNEREGIEGRIGFDLKPNKKWTHIIEAGIMSANYATNTTDKDRSDPTAFIFKYKSTLKMSEKWKFEIGAQRIVSDYTTGNFYVLTKGDLSVYYSPLKTLEFHAKASTQNSDYSHSQDSQKHTFSLATTYSINQFAGYGAQYEYTFNDSDASHGNYERHLTTMGVWLNF